MDGEHVLCMFVRTERQAGGVMLSLTSPNVVNEGDIVEE